MPRIGDVYSPPYDPVVTATPIESVEYNGTVADIAVDLNTPRPISAGGTGADNAAEAMSNLGGEGSKIQVTNYDSHVFTAGSFYSLANATAPPVAGHAFAGICYPAVVAGVATSDLFIEARDRDEPTQPGSSYVRQKKAGVWSGWLKAVGTASGPTPPSPAGNNALWWDPARGKLFIYYVDADTSQWVEAVAVPEIDENEITDAVDEGIAESAVRYDAAQTLTPAQQSQARQNIYAAPLDAMAYNNILVNGGFTVAQEYTITPDIQNSSLPICDVWAVAASGPFRVAAQVAGGVLGGAFRNYLSIAALTGGAISGAGDLVAVSQYIEGNRIRRLGWGAASGHSITLGFWISSGKSGNATVAIRNPPAFTQCYTATFTINAPSTWEFKTITIPASTTGAWVSDVNAGMIVGFVFAAGTSYHNPAPNTWVSASGAIGVAGQTNFFAATSDNVAISDVFILPGVDVPTPAQSSLIIRPYDQELTLVQRYYTKLPFIIIETSSLCYSVTFPTTMRTGPSMSGGGAGFTATVTASGGYLYQTTRAVITLVASARL